MNGRIRRIILGLAGALALQAPFALAQNGAGTTPPPAAAQPAKTAGKQTISPALWKVSDKDTTIYLFGTIHALPASLEWYQGRIAKALEGSDSLVTEISSSDKANLAAQMEQRAYLPEGGNLRESLPQTDRHALEDRLVSLGISVETFDRYKPWSAGLTLSLVPLLRAGFLPESGVEQVLDSKAPGSIRREALETVAYQVGVYDSLPAPTQQAYLNEVVKSLDQVAGQLDGIVAQWQRGDVKALARLFDDPASDPVLHQRLITDRNANWAEWIDQRLDQPGVVFVAVGTGHLVGKGSVQDQLKRRKIKSSRVK